MKKKWIAGIMAAVMGIGMLTGCGSKIDVWQKSSTKEISSQFTNKRGRRKGSTIRSERGNWGGCYIESGSLGLL